MQIDLALHPIVIEVLVVVVPDLRLDLVFGLLRNDLTLRLRSRDRVLRLLGAQIAILLFIFLFLLILLLGLLEWLVIGQVERLVGLHQVLVVLAQFRLLRRL